MSGKAAVESRRKNQCFEKSLNGIRPSRNVLQKEYVTSFKIAHFHFFIHGNGPSVVVGEYELEENHLKEVVMSYSLAEITVFPQLQVTVRGVIPMQKEEFILAFGANYLAIIELDQLKEGGHVCQSRIASVAAVIVGGRRVGANKVQVFYDDGGFENFELTKKMGGFEIVQKGAKKIGLQGAKVTSLVVSGPNVLLGTSRGQVLSHLGKIYLKGDESKGAVRQMTVINEHIVLLLFQNKSLALLDRRYHALRSTIEGRFTAVESVFFGGVIVAGDLDGTLHCLRIFPDGTKMQLVNSSKCIYRDAIIFLFPLNCASIICTTAIGSMFMVKREAFADTAEFFIHGLQFGSHLAKTCEDKWYFLQERRLYCAEGSLSTHLEIRLEYPDIEFSQLKHYRMDDFEVAYAFGGGHFFSAVTHKKKHWKDLMKFKERITTALVTEDYLLIQQGRTIKIHSVQKKGWKQHETLRLDVDSKVSAFSKTTMQFQLVVFVIALQNGQLYFTKASLKSPKNVSLSHLAKDFFVSVQSLNRHIYALSAKAKFYDFVYRTNMDDAYPNSPGYELLSFQNITNYKYPLGRGYDILIIDEGIYLVGFKQKMLNVYKVNEYQLLSLPSRGPRSGYLIHEDSETSIGVICDLGMGVISSSFPKIGRILNADVKHAGPITHVLVMSEFPVETALGFFADIVTGDCNGLVAVSSCVTVPNGSHVVTQMTYQLEGAISCMGRNGDYLFVGTSTGAMTVFQYRSGDLFRESKLDYPWVVTSVQCKANGPEEGALLGLSNGWLDALLRKPGDDKSDERFESRCVMGGEEVKDIKWSGWLNGPGRVFSLSRDGILYTREASLPDRGYWRSIDRLPAQRYSHFKDMELLEGRLTGLVAGYHNGMVLFAIYVECLDGWSYFTADSVHRHEIIDSIFYETLSESNCTFSLGTLDKSGLYVQRNVIWDFTGVRLHGLPMKWYCPVRKPKAMALLEKKKEVIVVGSGLATLFLDSLAPPPPIK